MQYLEYFSGPFFFLQVSPGINTSQIAPGINPTFTFAQSQSLLDEESPVPVINLKDGTRLAGDDAPKRKDLEKWLKEHPGYVEDLGAFIPVSILFNSGLIQQQVSFYVSMLYFSL